MKYLEELVYDRYYEYLNKNEKIAIIDGAENVVITGVVKDNSINNWGTPNDTSDDGLNAKTLFSIKY